MSVGSVERSAGTRHWRPTVAAIDLDAIRHNVSTLRPERAAVMAVVKADGYGHGDVPVARAALESGASWLGVALVEEGVRLRDAGIDAPILVLTEFPPGSERDALAAGLTPTLYSEDGLEWLVRARPGTEPAAGGVHDRPVGVHVKLDTGMHRVGLAHHEAPSFVRRVRDAGLDVEGVWTHFATSEDLDDPFTSVQLERFEEAVQRIRAAGVTPRILHAANSAALIARPETHFDMVRLGVAMYGLSPGPQLDVATGGLRPAMTWRSAVAFAKRVEAGEALSYGLTHRLERSSNVATIPVGYADGYSRSLSNRADVLIRGRRRRVAGTVSMDQLLVECGDDPVERGDEVILIGRQGDQEITAAELARLMGTICYEVVCAVSERVPREYAHA